MTHLSAQYQAVADYLASRAQSAPVGGQAQKQAAFRSSTFASMAHAPGEAASIYQTMRAHEDLPPATGDVATFKQATSKLPVNLPELPQAQFSHQYGGRLHLHITSELAYGLCGNLDETLAKIEAAKEVFLGIDSTGGDTNVALVLYRALKGKTIEATAHGKCWSAATLLWMASPVRKVTANTTILVHQPTCAIFGTLAEAARAVEQNSTVLQIMLDCYEQAGCRMDYIASWLADGKDHWLTPTEACEVGLATEIVTDPKCECEICESVQPTA